MGLTDVEDARSSINHIPNGRWIFDEEVTAVFEDMLSKSIPQYATMRRAVFELGLRYVQDDTAVVDLGCSKGDALAPFVRELSTKNTFIGIDSSQPMVHAAQTRFQADRDRPRVSISHMDLRQEYPNARSSLTLSILTLQFVPLEYRQHIVANAYANLVKEGAFVLVEKVMCSTAALSNTMVELYHRNKREAGYSDESIERKRLSLEGVLVPITAAWNEDMLRSAGFRHVDCFWRWMNFSGWIAVK